MQPPPRPEHLARYAAPAAFLVALTILIVLVHSALSSGGGTTTAAQRTTHRTTRHTTRKQKPKPATTASATLTSTATTPTTTGPAQYYTVQSGDTFGSIAAREGTTVAQLEQLNPSVSSNSLQVGQQIRVK